MGGRWVLRLILGKIANGSAARYPRAVRRRALLFCLATASLFGCQTPVEEGLVVNLQSDYVPGVEFTSIEVSVDEDTTRSVTVTSRDVFARPRAIETFTGLAPGNHLVGVSLRLRGAEIAARRVQVQLSGSFLVTVIVTRACGGVRCAPGETCAGGRCVSPMCVDGTEPSCPPPGCIEDGDCTSDTACVLPSCVASVCLETPRDDRCASTQVCVPGTGCVERPADPDAGAPDAGPPPPCRSAGDCTEGRMCCDDGACRTACVAGSCAGQPAGAVCRPAEGPCDRAETCDGTSPTCPRDDRFGSETTCRPAMGPCDVAEQCTGAGPECPGDAFVAGTVCRDAAGPCDDEERCSGSSPDCPADAWDRSGRLCRDARGPCDEPERCHGDGPHCASDALAGAGAECRRAEGVCDLAELCDGSSIECPPDRFVSGGVECRGTGGECGLAETCPGDGPHCPTDVHRPSTWVCRWGASSCDVIEYCSGDGGECPADAYRPNGESCDERCGSEYCDSGACAGGTDCSGADHCESDSYCTPWF